MSYIKRDENGLLHGQPAIYDENTKHQEYWVHGKLHRGGGLPAVIWDDLKHLFIISWDGRYPIPTKAWYVNGELIREEFAEFPKSWIFEAERRRLRHGEL